MGNYAFIGEGLGLTILDISDPESAHVIGRSLPMPEIAEDIALDGDYAYIADGWGSLRIFDVSSPASPIEVGFIYPDYYRYARGIEVVGNYAYVASARDWTVKHPIVDSKPGLSIVDISDPTTPVEIAFYEIDQNGSPLLSDVAVEKDRAFLSYGPGCVPCTGGLYVFDISKPKSPEVLSTIQLPGFASRINVVDKYAYVSNLRFFRLDDPSGVSGLSIIDIADPANPLDVGFIQTIGQANSVAVLNNRAYVGGGTAGLYVMDISDPTQPQLISEVDTPQNADGVAAAGNFAYVADHAGGLRIINTLDPAAPAETSFYNPAIPTNLTVDGSYAYVTSGESGLRIIDIGDHEHPEEVGMVETPGFAQQVTVQGKTAYVANGTNGMRIISVANPAVPRELGYFDTPGEARAVAVRGNYAFMADGDSGMRIIEVSTPKSPIEVGFFETMITANDIVIDQDLVYLAADTGLYIINVSNPVLQRCAILVRTKFPAI